MALHQPTIPDLLAAVDALKDQLADALRENRCLLQQVHDLETEISTLRASKG